MLLNNLEQKYIIFLLYFAIVFAKTPFVVGDSLHFLISKIGFGSFVKIVLVVTGV